MNKIRGRGICLTRVIDQWLSVVFNINEIRGRGFYLVHALKFLFFIFFLSISDRTVFTSQKNNSIQTNNRTRNSRLSFVSIPSLLIIDSASTMPAFAGRPSK